MHLLSEAEQVAGPVALEWDGRDHTGGLVAPGNHVLRVEVSGDARTDLVSRRRNRLTKLGRRGARLTRRLSESYQWCTASEATP